MRALVLLALVVACSPATADEVDRYHECWETMRAVYAVEWPQSKADHVAHVECEEHLR